MCARIFISVLHIHPRAIDVTRNCLAPFAENSRKNKSENFRGGKIAYQTLRKGKRALFFRKTAKIAKLLAVHCKDFSSVEMYGGVALTFSVYLLIGEKRAKNQSWSDFFLEYPRALS